jgi:hypothetical protein
VGRFVSADPIGLRGGINLYGYTANNPLIGIDPYGLDVFIIITTDSYFGIRIRSHVALYIDGTNGNEPFLYDPSGSYLQSTRGSAGCFMGNEANLDSYKKYHQSFGSTIETFRFGTTATEEAEIMRRAVEDLEDPRGLNCALFVSSAITGVGEEFFLPLAKSYTKYIGKRLGGNSE